MTTARLPLKGAWIDIAYDGDTLVASSLVMYTVGTGIGGGIVLGGRLYRSRTSATEVGHQVVGRGEDDAVVLVAGLVAVRRAQIGPEAFRLRPRQHRRERFVTPQLEVGRDLRVAGPAGSAQRSQSSDPCAIARSTRGPT